MPPEMDTGLDADTDNVTSFVPADAIAAADADSGGNGPEPLVSAEPSSGTPGEPAQTPETPQPDLMSVFDDEIANLEGGKPASQTPDPALELPEGVDPTSKAGNRWQQLANANREQRTELAQAQQSIQDYTNYTQQLQQWAQNQVQQQQQQVQHLQQQVQQLTQQLSQSPQAQLPTTPEEQALAKLKQDFLGSATDAFGQKLDPLTQRLDRIEQSYRQQQTRQEQQRNADAAKQQALQATRAITLRGLPDELMQGPAAEEIAAQVMTRALYHNTSIEEAAKMVRLSHFRFARAVAKAGAATLQDSLKRSGTATQAPAGQSADGTPQRIPTEEELVAAGYGPDDLLEWSIRTGNPLPQAQ